MRRFIAILCIYAVVLTTVMLFLNGCASTPPGVYSVGQVTQGLQDSVDAGLLSVAQADAVGGKIAAAHTGIQWGAILGTIGTMASTLALGYLGIRKVDNKHILGSEEAAALAELVRARLQPQPQPVSPS